MYNYTESTQQQYRQIIARDIAIMIISYSSVVSVQHMWIIFTKSSITVHIVIKAAVQSLVWWLQQHDNAVKIEITIKTPLKISHDPINLLSFWKWCINGIQHKYFAFAQSTAPSYPLKSWK